MYLLLKIYITWYTDGSRSNQGAGAGMYKARPMDKHYVSLGKLATVFQAELTAIDQCAMRNVEKGYKNRTICIVSDSKAAIKSLSSNYFTRKGV